MAQMTAEMLQMSRTVVSKWIDTDIQGRSHLVYLPMKWHRQPCGSHWRSLGFCWPHRHKQTQNKYVHNLCAPCRVLCVCIFTLRLQQMQVTYAPNKVILTGKNWKPPIWAPCQDKNDAGSGIFFVYLWCLFRYKCWNKLCYNSDCTVIAMPSEASQLKGFFQLLKLGLAVLYSVWCYKQFDHFNLQAVVEVSQPNCRIDPKLKCGSFWQ